MCAYVPTDEYKKKDEVGKMYSVRENKQIFGKSKLSLDWMKWLSEPKMNPYIKM